MIYGIIIVLILIIGVLGTRLWLYRSQIHHINKKLSMLSKEDTNYRLSSYCHVGKTDEMIELLNKMLLENREKIGKFANDNRLYKESITSISHDIRTPLTSAKGYTQMIAGGSLSAEKQQLYIQKVEQRIDDVTEMLNQLFEYTRVEAGELEFSMEKVNLNNIFMETVSMFYDDFAEKNCEPIIEMEETPCYIYADKRAMIRIIENLIKNALVHGNGGYRFQLKKKEKEVVLEVSNRTGSIEEKDLDRIFDRFYTTDQSRTRKTTGLGLAIVKRFANQMGGEAKAYLERGIFTIEVRFPMMDAK